MIVGYATGQACINGHKITGDISHGNGCPFCPTCGAPTVEACEHCRAPMRGNIELRGSITSRTAWSGPPAHCFKCGKPFPWTAAGLQAVAELADAIEELTDHERAELASLMPDLVSETPRTKVAGFKVLTILARLKEPARAALKGVMADVVVEAGKAALGL